MTRRISCILDGKEIFSYSAPTEETIYDSWEETVSDAEVEDLLRKFNQAPRYPNPPTPKFPTGKILNFVRR